MIIYRCDYCGKDLPRGEVFPSNRKFETDLCPDCNAAISKRYAALDEEMREKYRALNAEIKKEAQEIINAKG